MHTSPWSRLVYACLFNCLTLAAANAAVPDLKYLFPAGASRGSSRTITLSGKFDGNGREVWTSVPGVRFTPGAKADTLEVTVDKNAPLGPCLVRLINAEGASKPFWFSIGALTEIDDKEPNDELGKEQFVDKLPVTIDGKLEKGSTADLFAFDLKAGQSVYALVEAYSLGSMVDPALELRDASGTTVATVHDARNLDPVLRYTATKAGRFSLQLAGFSHPPAANVAFVGGSSIFYRLHLTTGPVVCRVYPPAISLIGKSPLQLSGINLTEKEKTWTPDVALLRAGQAVQQIDPPNAVAPFQVAVVDTPVEPEVEPNDTVAQAQPISVPGCAAGTISKAGDVDLFAFKGVKAKSYRIEVMSKQLGLPLDARISVLDTKNSEITSVDDGGAAEDAATTFKASADGIYVIKVSDLFGKGGELQDYALIVRPAFESFTATVSGGTEYSIKSGQTVEIKGKVNAPVGISGELTARVQGLPPDVTATEVPAIKKNGQEFTIKLRAASDAAPGSYPIVVTLWPVDEKLPWQRVPATINLRGENQRYTSLLDETADLFLTVLPSPHTAAKIESPAPKRSELSPAPPPAAPKK